MFPEFGCHALWWGGGLDEPLGDIDPFSLPISKHLAADLVGWSQKFDDTLDQDYPPDSKFSSAAAKEEFVDEGRILAVALAESMGTQIEVTYHDIISGVREIIQITTNENHD